MSRFIPKLGVVLLAAGVLSLPSQAQAQFVYQGYGPYVGGGYGFGGFGYGGYGYGGYGYGGWGYGRYGYLGGYGWGPSYGAAFGGAMGLSYNTAWSFPVRTYQAAYGPPEVLVPGFGASDMPRARATVYPAISAPARVVSESPAQALDKDRACIAMQLPCAGAQVYLDGVPTTQTGRQRRFVTPRLNHGTQYCFSVEVRWQDEAGQACIATRQVNVRPGETATLDIR